MKAHRIFIAFASDCDAERRAIHEVCRSDRSIKALCREYKISLDCVDFRDVSSDAGRPQGLINSAALKWKPDWFIFIFWRRLGSDAGLGMTGMEEEWSHAIALNRKGSGHPRVSLYFNQAEGNAYDTDATQAEALQRFQTGIFEEYKALATFFNGTRKFREQFHTDLTCRLIEVDRGAGSLDLDQEFKQCSAGLLSWPRTLGANDEIDRPELQVLLSKAQSHSRSITLIIGDPGSGKSALLAKLGHTYLSKGFSVLAIKSDRLGKGIHNSEDLRKYLNLSLVTQDAVRKAAETKPVVLLIDQLDAISELVDRQSDRLNVLLNLIQELSERDRVHIIASCRVFECNHDIRLNGLDADRLTLALPSWDHIAPILTKAGYDPAMIGSSTRELLRSPWCLKLFLDVAKPDTVFSTFQSLLEELWYQKVLTGEQAKRRIDLLEFLAKRMSAHEMLWLPSSLADSWPTELRELIREDILCKGPDDLTIGFRHQTFYDWTLARAFAKGALSLSRHVIERQDGLFVRPVLLNGLQYLRGTRSPVYHSELKALFDRRIRLHIRSLLIEFLGGLKDPDDVEFYLIIRRLKTNMEAPRVLASIAGSPGWFNRINNTTAFLSWARKAPPHAVHVLNVLCLAINFNPDRVLELIETLWLPKKSHDELTLRVFSYLSAWTMRSVVLACAVLRRTSDRTAPLLVDQAAKGNPDLATILARAALDGSVRHLTRLIAKAKRNKGLPQKGMPSVKSSLEKAKQELVQFIGKEEEWYNLDALAETAPKPFLDNIWPWFMNVSEMIGYEENEFALRYRDDPATYREFEDELTSGSIVKALLAAVTRLAQQMPDQFVEFARSSQDCDLNIVHRLLARGFRILVQERASLVLEYLLGDPRRLEIGDFADHHRESKALIIALSPYLTGPEMSRLEEAVMNFKQYNKKTMSHWTPKERFDRMQWTRVHRLRLLRAFPSGYLSRKTQAFREEEERALPGVNDYSARGGAGFVGPRITANEMEKATSGDLLNLFKELPDSTKGSNPKRQWTLDFERAGGARQLARELGELAKSQPERVLMLLNDLEPGQEETYASQALVGLAEGDVETSRLIASITSLGERGFSTGGFREEVSRALKIRALRDRGLPQIALEMLEDWLSCEGEPKSSENRDTRDDADVKQGREILFGHSPTWVLPHGRGPIIETIAEGYLQQTVPNYSGWANVITARLGIEKHPAVWVMTLMRMPPLFNWDRKRATELVNTIIEGNPDVLDYHFGLHPIARVMGLCVPKSSARIWINMLRSRRSDFSQQAYGEFLFLYHCQHNDSWSRSKLATLLRAKSSSRILLGLAHGASHLWKDPQCRTHATKILAELALSKNPLTIRAITNLFRLTRDEFELDPQAHRLIQKIARNKRAVLSGAEDLLTVLLPHLMEAPKLVLQICNVLLGAGPREAKKYIWSSVPEDLTNIALTLHRQKQFRIAGLQLFETLLEMNLGEAKAALDVLDRNPVIKPTPSRPRRQRRRKRTVAAP